jgi:hypothetical protein
MDITTLAIMSEEAAEVAQAATKAMRFGLDNTNLKTGQTNLYACE